MLQRMIRRWRALTEEEVRAIGRAATPEAYANCGFSDGPYRPPLSDELTGREFSFDFADGSPSCAYRFLSKNEVEWCDKSGTHRDYCEVLPSSVEHVWFIQHLVKDSDPITCRILVVDEDTNCVTLCHSWIGTPVAAREVTREFHFGTISGKERKGDLHHFTDELVGRAIEWTYKHDDFRVKHIYTSEYYYTYAMRRGSDLCWMASNPADFVKIRDGLYIFSFLEERQGGTQGFFLMDLKEMHDVASFFGISADEKLECYTAGAIGRWAKMETYFEHSDENL